jgi:hypothetical protein
MHGPISLLTLLVCSVEWYRITAPVPPTRCPRPRTYTDAMVPNNDGRSPGTASVVGGAASSSMPTTAPSSAADVASTTVTVLAVTAAIVLLVI